jgi:hypothetical protein
MRSSEVPWVRVGPFLLPDLPPHVPVEVDRLGLSITAARRGALGAFWPFDWDCGPTSWWYVICDAQGYDLDAIASKNARRDTRYGLARTDVRRVEPGWLAANGYELYLKATRRYAGHNPRNLEEYYGTILGVRTHAGDPPWEFWGVFDRKDNLVASANCRLQAGCCIMSTATFDPDAGRLFPMNALYFTLARHYLNERGLSYLASGARPVSHDTRVEEFRLRMGWRKCHTRLGALLPPPIALGARAWDLLRPALGRVIPLRSRWVSAADGLATLVRASRETSP